MEDLMTVKTSDFEADLAVAKSYLNDKGIDCVINSEYLTVSPIEGKAARLQVRSEDYRRTIELLVEGGFAEYSDYDYREE